MTGFRFNRYAADGDDLGATTFSAPNSTPGDVVALTDHVYRVRDVVYLDENEDGDVRGLLMLERPVGFADG